MARAVGVLYVPGVEYMYGCGDCRTLSVFEDDEFVEKKCANEECRRTMALPANKAHWVPWTGTAVTTWAQWVEACDRAARAAAAPHALERDFSYRRSLTPLETPQYNAERSVFGSSVQNLPDCVYNEAGQGFPKNVRQLTWMRYHDPDIRPSKKGISLESLEKVLGFALGQLGDYGVRLDGLWVLFERHKGRGYSTVKVGTHEEMIRAMPDNVYALYLNDTERVNP